MTPPELGDILQCARHAEKLLLAFGCQGGPCGGNRNTKMIYLYRIGPNTRK